MVEGVVGEIERVVYDCISGLQSYLLTSPRLLKIALIVGLAYAMHPYHPSFSPFSRRIIPSKNLTISSRLEKLRFSPV